MLHGCYFLLAGTASLSLLLGTSLDKLIGAKWVESYCAITWVAYEVSFAVSFLVSIIVTYVLIPDSSKRGDAVNILFRPVALLTHNANVMFMVFELLVNKLQFNATHFTFAVEFGLLYTIFSWYMYSRIKLFYYFFLDYNRKDNIVVYLGLASIVSNHYYTLLYLIFEYYYSILTSLLTC